MSSNDQSLATALAAATCALLGTTAASAADSEADRWSFDTALLYYGETDNRVQDVRILRDTTPPSIRMRYVLRRNGRVLTRSEETVSDMNYLMRPSARPGGYFALRSFSFHGFTTNRGQAPLNYGRG